MAAIYGHRWTSAYGERCDEENGNLTIPGDTWQRGLNDVGERRIGTGLNACVMSVDPWPPTLPAFRAMCFSVPSLASAKLAISGKAPRTPFTRMLWSYIDGYRLSRADEEHADRIVRDAYELTCKHVMAGGSLPEDAAAAITKDAPEKPKPCDPETAAAHIDKIASLFRAAPTIPDADVE